MRICDICRSEGVRYDTFAVIDNKGNTSKLELCGRCYTELECRGKQYLYLAYTETVKARRKQND